MRANKGYWQLLKEFIDEMLTLHENFQSYKKDIYGLLRVKGNIKVVKVIPSHAFSDIKLLFA